MIDDLTERQRFALTALLEVQPAATVGDFVGETDEGEYLTSYRFETTLTGYPGWVWTITVADLPDEHPTIVESELMPVEGALLAPDWIPWSERMDEYRAAQAALGEAETELAIGAEDDESDDDDDDVDDDDLLGSDNLHGGDLDGVDIDEIDDSGEELIEFDSELSDGELTPDAEAVVDLEALDLQVDESDDPEAESSSGSENPPRVARRRKRSGEKQQDDQGD